MRRFCQLLVVIVGLRCLYLAGRQVGCLFMEPGDGIASRISMTLSLVVVALASGAVLYTLRAATAKGQGAADLLLCYVAGPLLAACLGVALLNGAIAGRVTVSARIAAVDWNAPSRIACVATCALAALAMLVVCLREIAKAYAAERDARLLPEAERERATDGVVLSLLIRIFLILPLGMEAIELCYGVGFYMPSPLGPSPEPVNAIDGSIANVIQGIALLFLAIKAIEHHNAGGDDTESPGERTPREAQAVRP